MATFEEKSRSGQILLITHCLQLGFIFNRAFMDKFDVFLETFKVGNSHFTRGSIAILLENKCHWVKVITGNYKF